MSKFKKHYILFGVIFLVLILILVHIAGFFWHTRPAMEEWTTTTHSGTIVETSSSTITIENIREEEWTFNINDATEIWQGKKKSNPNLLFIGSRVLINEDTTATNTAKVIRVIKDQTKP
jgi:hypothetical protein